MFEAKHTETDRFEFDRVTDIQNKKLSRIEQLGGVAFVLLSFRMQTFARIPWQIWQNMKDVFGHKYISEKDAAPYRISTHGMQIRFLNNEDFTSTP